MRFIFIFLFVLVFFYIFVASFLYFKQSDFLYHPRQEVFHIYNNLNFKNDGVNIHVILANEDKEDAILYFGGNAESGSRSSDYIVNQFPNHAIYILDYRGFGKSEGKPSEKALYSDALKLYDIVSKKHKKISIGGRSLGTGIATYVASKRDVYRLALITPFDSILELAEDRYYMFPVKYLLKEFYDSGSRVKDISAKTYIVIAENDKIVPKKSSLKLLSKFPKNQIIFREIKNSNHRTISDSKIYFEKMQEFINN